ncbi:GNAT family N-acetyltransferase [Streptomyces tremellae]|uniref:Lysine N-acyltransferase MbtK n=1 Tax=Streptomyces tremellae TaxID=1124239 RepID=A0ABP7GCD4_9ACTN
MGVGVMETEFWRDGWGVPHVRAGSHEALAHGQGQVTARDRAWQLHVEQHRAEGTSASFLGPSAVAWDRFARRARLADTARRCFAALDPRTASWVTAYAAGVNAGLAQGAAAAPEFAAARTAPGQWRPWTPIGVWLSAHILFAGFPAKLWRTEVAKRLGEDAVDLFATDGPGTSGSNGWLVPGGLTATGSALLAGDPHRFIEAPGVYQQIRLACPEYDVVGLAVPGVPGLAHFGHAGSVAWSVTNSMADYQDLYEERLSPGGPTGLTARGPAGPRPAHRHTEVIEVAGAAPVEVEVVETERGPVVLDGSPGEPPGDPAGGGTAAVSLRHLPRVRADAGFRTLPALLRARTVEDVDRALDHWVEPVNVVLAADTAGGLLHRVAGAVPVRDRAASRRVVPARDGRHAWRDGQEAAPRAPVTGPTVMANAPGIATPLGVEFAPPHRERRIRALLARAPQGGWRAADMAAIHTDTLLASADTLLTAVAEAPVRSAPAAALRGRLLRWDRRMDAESEGAAAYARLRAEVVRRVAAHPALAPLAGIPGYPEPFSPWLAPLPRVAYALESLLGSRLVPPRERTALVADALDAVAGEGPQGARPVWGDTHRLVWWQALPCAPATELPPLGGDHDCVLSTSSVPGATDLSARGPAARYVWDLHRRDDSRWVVPFGASGVPDSPHHRDQLPLWLRGELAPVTTDWGLLTKETAMTAPRTPSSAPLHESRVDGFGTVTVTPLDAEADADLLHSWVSEDRARFWGMTGATRDEVRDAYAHMATLTTHHAHLVRRDGTPVALLVTYDATADRVAECYQARPGDTGIHLLLGPPPGGRADAGFTAALLSVIVDFVLADPACRRIVAEPDAANEKALARFARSGFEPGPEIVLPEVDLPEVRLPAKRARLVVMDRAAVAARGHAAGRGADAGAGGPTAPAGAR